ncbi:MAG: hypothetical protein WD512_17440 [Candidatus Paceibacterota bacterium]
MADDMEQYSKQLYEKVKAKIPNNQVTAGNIFDLIRISMEEVEKFKELAGRSKKELVIRILHEIVKDYVLDDVENETIKILLDNFVDIIIDTFVDIDMGHLKINEDQKKVIRKLFPCCFK